MIDPRKTIIVNGQEVGEGWDRVLAEAQQDRTYSIAGEVFERIPFGEDYAGEASDAPSCRDCAAARGQLHVPVCCLEQCPRCGGQLIGCDCEHDDDLEDDDGEVQE
jgi:hypothetical protein